MSEPTEPLRPTIRAELSAYVRDALEAEGCAITEDGSGGVVIAVPARAVRWLNGTGLQAGVGGLAIKGVVALFGGGSREG